MTWAAQPSWTKTGNLADEARAKRFANPPSNPGLCGLQISTSPSARKGHVFDGVVGVSMVTKTPLTLKGKPFK